MKPKLNISRKPEAHWSINNIRAAIGKRIERVEYGFREHIENVHESEMIKGGAYLHFRIDTRMPVSENIELISIALKHEHQFRQDEGSKLAELENKERQKFPDYAFALEAKKFGLSHYQIACALWPKQYSPKAGDTEQKSKAKASVSKYLKKADALVKNYYRLLLQSGEAQLGFI